MTGVYCPRCGNAVLGFNRVTPHESECVHCDAVVTARWDGKTLKVSWNDDSEPDEEDTEQGVHPV